MLKEPTNFSQAVRKVSQGPSVTQQPTTDDSGSSRLLENSSFCTGLAASASSAAKPKHHY